MSWKIDAHTVRVPKNNVYWRAQHERVMARMGGRSVELEPARKPTDDDYEDTWVLMGIEDAETGDVIAEYHEEGSHAFRIRSEFDLELIRHAPELYAALRLIVPADVWVRFPEAHALLRELMDFDDQVAQPNDAALLKGGSNEA